jgi:hypothetical protein
VPEHRVLVAACVIPGHEFQVAGHGLCFFSFLNSFSELGLSSTS